MSHSIAGQAGNVTTDEPRAPGSPLGPGSMLWRIAGDWHCMLPGPSAGIMQLMWPHLGRGVEEHSAFFTEPADRILRSVPRIWATILADDADARGLAIRDLHRDIKGTDARGDRYHALEPETFWWAHATFSWEMFQTIDRWDHRRLSVDQREQLYQETVTWYRRYGVSDRPVPVDHLAFERRFDEICRHELEMTPTAARAIEIALDHRPPPMPGMQPRLASLLGPVMRVATIGGLPPAVRNRFGIPFSLADEALLAALTVTVRNAGAVVPHSLTRTPFLARIRDMKHRAAPHAGTT